MNTRPVVRASRSLAIALALAAQSACGGSPWNVAHQANPNPFPSAQHSFALAPVSFDGVRIVEGTEAEYVAHAAAADQSAWESAKRGLGAHLVSAATAARDGVTIANLEGAPASVPFVIRPTVTFVQPGSGANNDAIPCEVRLEVSITRRDGAVLDSFSIGTGLATTPNSTVPQRLERAGDNLGGLIVRYVRERSGL